jgi:WD40 repeat protein
MTNGAVELWNLATRQCIGNYQVPGGEARLVKFSPKASLLLVRSRQLVEGDWKSTLTVVNLATGQPHGRFEDRFAGSRLGFAFSPDETLLAAAASDYTITVRNLATQKDLAVLKAHTWDINTLAFSPDGKRLTSASIDNTLRLWDTATWQELDVLRGHMGGVRAAAFSADGKMLASGSADEAIKLWDVSSIPGQEILSIRSAPHNPRSVMLSPDSSVLAVTPSSGVTGREGEVLLLRAPSFVEIEASEKAKAAAQTTIR